MKLRTLFILIVLASTGCSDDIENKSFTGPRHVAIAVATPPNAQTKDPSDQQWNTFRNDVNGVAIGSDHADVIRQFGPPVSIRKGGENPCGGDKSILRYSGIEFTLDQDESKRNIVVVIKITSPKWNMTPGIRTGLSVDEVRGRMGRSGTYKNNGGGQLLWYGDGDGYLNFFFKKDKVEKIVRDLNQC